MSDPVLALTPKTKHPDEVLLMGWEFTALLEAGETIDVVQAVEALPDDSADPGGLQIGPAQANTDTFLNDRSESVAVGKAVQATVSGGLAGSDYHVTARVLTSLSQVRTLTGVLVVDAGGVD